jgi:cellulose biosynthesis protein BcsQ
MTKIIALFNHKGGVSKTTTTFNLGWALADRGKSVLMIDADPQCNLTGTVLGFAGDDDFQNFYDSRPRSNLAACLSPTFQGAQTPLSAAQIESTSQKGLTLLAGHIDLAESETQLAVALSAGSAIPALQNLPGALSHLLRITAREHNVDVVLIDLSPSVGALNECFLMGSDFFIVPTFPDYFCDQAVRSLSRVIPRWHKGVMPFRNENLAYRLPHDPPKFLGIISQRYRPRHGEPASSFQRWIDVIKQTANTTLVPALDSLGMTVTEAEFRKGSKGDTPYNLMNIADFNTLIAQSQKHNTPVFALSDAQIERQGIVLDQMKANRENFRTTFHELADAVIALAGIDSGGLPTRTGIQLPHVDVFGVLNQQTTVG